MAFILKDRVKETTNTTGTADFGLAGAVVNCRSFADIGNTNTTMYAALDPVTGAWETGLGTYSTTGPKLARTTVGSNSLGTTAKISFVNSPIVWCDATVSFLTNPTLSGLTVNGAMSVSGAAAFTGAATFSGLVTVGQAVKNTNAKTAQASGSAISLFTVSNGSSELTLVKVKLVAGNNDVQRYYSTCLRDLLVAISDSSGTDLSTVTVIGSKDASINGGVINLSLAFSVSRSAGVETFSVTPTLAGSGGATQVNVWAEFEAIGTQAGTLTAV